MLLIRADADAQTGSGHVMRCLALAQAWQDQVGPVTYLCAAIPESLEARLFDQGIRVIRMPETPGSAGDREATLRHLASLTPSWVVLDSYKFDQRYHQAIVAGSAARVLVLDDQALLRHYASAAVLNQNLGATDSLYAGKLSAATTLLAGSSFAMLRREFLETPRPVRSDLPPRRLLVTLGGSDPGNHSSSILRVLQSVLGSEHHVTLVVSSSHAHLSSLRSMLKQAPFQGTLACDVKDMASLMAESDLAISAAGSTCWELACMQLPCLLLSVADNQIPLARAMADQGAAIDLGPADALDESRLAATLRSLIHEGPRCLAMSQAAASVVDGKGVYRVLEAMAGPSLTLRPVTMNDARLLWDWRNEPATRAASFSSQIIPLESHIHWLQRRLDSASSQLYIACDLTDEPIGQIRFDLDQSEALISFSIAPQARGRKLASRLLRCSGRRILRQTNVSRLVGYVRVDNMASHRAFLRAGYTALGEETVQGQQAIRYELQAKDAATL